MDGQHTGHIDQGGQTFAAPAVLQQAGVANHLLFVSQAQLCALLGAVPQWLQTASVCHFLSLPVLNMLQPRTLNTGLHDTKANRG